MATKAKIGVLGASGYTGGELVRVLLRHPRAEIVLLTAERSAGKAMRDVFPQFSPFELPTLVAIEASTGARPRLDVAFCALPHATTQKVIKDLLAKSPAHQGDRSVGRFPAGRHRGLCEMVWPRASRAGTAERSGLRPYRNPPARNQDRRGWWPIPAAIRRCAQLPLIPLIKDKAIELDEIVIDAKSGMTGAGGR